MGRLNRRLYGEGGKFHPPGPIDKIVNGGNTMTNLTYSIDITTITRAAMAVRGTRSAYQKWRNQHPDDASSTLFSLLEEIYKAETRLDTLAEVLCISHAQMWQIVRVCEKCGVKMNRYNYRLQSCLEVKQSVHEEFIFNKAFENALRNKKGREKAQ